MLRYVGRCWPLSMRFCQANNKIFGIASKMGGSSNDSLYDRYAGKFFNKDL